MITPNHKHLVLYANINKFPNKYEKEIIVNFMKDLVESIGMTVLKGPIVSYVEDSGNVGWTSTILLKTSHASLHIWNEWGILQADLYSCKEFNHVTVLDKIKHTFDVTLVKYRILDRNGGVQDEDGLKIQEYS